MEETLIAIMWLILISVMIYIATWFPRTMGAIKNSLTSIKSELEEINAKIEKK